MSRSQQNQVFKTATDNSKQDQSNAQTAFNDAETGLKNYYSSDPYQPGGQFAKDASNINAARANANGQAVNDALTRHGKTSGENPAGYASNVVAANRQGTLDEADAQSKSDAQRLDSETKYQQFGIGANTAISGQNLNAANGALSTGQQAAKEPGMWDTLFNDAIQGAKTGGEIAAA
jgi:hypothetical protein